MPSTNIPGAIISNSITLTPDVDGLVTLPIDETGEGLLVQIDGAVLKGIRPVNGVDGNNDPVTWEPGFDALAATVWIGATRGGVVQVEHMSEDVDPAYRIFVTAERTAFADWKNFSIKYVWLEDEEHWAWEFDYWSATSAVWTMPAMTSLVSGSSSYIVYRGAPGTIASVDYVMTGGLTPASTATIELRINGVAVTNGGVSIGAGDAGAGEKFAATPTAANVLADGDVLSLHATGDNLLTTALGCTLSLAI